MRVSQKKWSEAKGWGDSTGAPLDKPAQLVLAFGVRNALADGGAVQKLKELYPEAAVVACSTAGEICGTEVLDNSIVATAVAFNSTTVRVARRALSEAGNSLDLGKLLAADLLRAHPDPLVHVIVLSDGLQINGSELVKGLASTLPEGVAVTGGLSGDGAKFEKTLVSLDGKGGPGDVVAIGLYGKHLRVGYGSLGGWDSFGPERVVTRSKGNVLYELDGESALGLYKKYLGEHAAGLPATGLRFPLTLRAHANDTPVVRTILAIDEKEQSLTFAGDIPQGTYARLMKANFDRLVDGATGAAKESQLALGDDSAELAILISCVGRKLIFKQRTEEEVESVRAVLGETPALTGFYSYGEISPFTANAKCELHNQTMTVTVLAEKVLPEAA